MWRGSLNDRVTGQLDPLPRLSDCFNSQLITPSLRKLLSRPWLTLQSLSHIKRAANFPICQLCLWQAKHVAAQRNETYGASMFDIVVAICMRLAHPASIVNQDPTASVVLRMHDDRQLRLGLFSPGWTCRHQGCRNTCVLTYNYTGLMVVRAW